MIHSCSFSPLPIRTKDLKSCPFPFFTHFPDGEIGNRENLPWQNDSYTGMLSKSSAAYVCLVVEGYTHSVILTDNNKVIILVCD